MEKRHKIANYLFNKKDQFVKTQRKRNYNDLQEKKSSICTKNINNVESFPIRILVRKCI